MPRLSFPTLPAAHLALRVLVFLNWVYAGIVLAILIGLIASQRWTMTALGIPPSAQTPRLATGLAAIALLGLLAVPLNLGVLKRLLGMVQTVSAGDPFVAANAYRLQSIAWFLLAQQVLSVIVGFIGKAVSTPAHTLHLSAGFSPGAWLAVIMTFVLARVFADGTLMREDLEGTV